MYVFWKGIKFSLEVGGLVKSVEGNGVGEWSRLLEYKLGRNEVKREVSKV